jgi:hypothetical protein
LKKHPLQLENKNNPINTITSISLEKKIVLSRFKLNINRYFYLFYTFLSTVSIVNKQFEKKFSGFTGKFPDISRIKPAKVSASPFSSQRFLR